MATPGHYLAYLLSFACITGSLTKPHMSDALTSGNNGTLFESKLVHETDTCQHVIRCAEHEVCFKQQYSNSSMNTLYSLGCTNPALCRNDSLGEIFGRRNTEHNHGLCHKCCNSSYCNLELKCLDKSNEKSVNESCLSSNECASNLVCTSGKCVCPSGDYILSNNSCITKPLECADIDFTTDGLYFIYPIGNHPVEVNCVIREGVKWTVFQRRLDGSVNFGRTWNEYKAGFGNISGEFWLGNDVLHLISSNGQHRLRVELGTPYWNFYAIYSHFLVESDSNKYRLNVSGYQGDAGDCLNNDRNPRYKANGMMFTTVDSDNDQWSDENCAADKPSGWWYNSCNAAELNRYPGMWAYNLGWSYFIHTTTMMITKA